MRENFHHARNGHPHPPFRLPRQAIFSFPASFARASYVQLGQYSFIGATNKVVKDILPFMISDGNPSVGRVVNSIGLQRHGFDPDRIKSIKTMIKYVGTSKHSLTGMIDILQNNYPQNVDAIAITSLITRSRLGIALPN